jgi:hypothetical protein
VLSEADQAALTNLGGESKIERIEWVNALNGSLSNLRIETAAYRSLLAKGRYRGAFGDGSGKSHFFFAGLGIEEYLSQPGALVVCIRETQRTLATLLNVCFCG